MEIVIVAFLVIFISVTSSDPLRRDGIWFGQLPCLPEQRNNSFGPGGKASSSNHPNKVFDNYVSCRLIAKVGDEESDSY
jgi:hypothetical protein